MGLNGTIIVSPDPLNGDDPDSIIVWLFQQQVLVILLSGKSSQRRKKQGAGAVACPLDWRNIINQKLQSLGLNQAVMGKVNCVQLYCSLFWLQLHARSVLFPRSIVILLLH
jgi:hypothetical protein